MAYAAALIAAFALGCAAQAVRTPAKGSVERTAILNVLRSPIERDLKQKVVFQTDAFNIAGNWAFISGTPQNASGGRLDLSKTKFAEAEREGYFGGNFFGLLQRSGGKWRVVTYQIGCTDVCYSDWWRRYKAPKAVFPYTE